MPLASTAMGGRGAIALCKPEDEMDRMAASAEALQETELVGLPGESTDAMGIKGRASVLDPDIKSEVSLGRGGLGADTYKPSNCFFAFLNRIVPYGGGISNAYNLAAVTIGSGVLSLPSSFQFTGIIPAVVMLVLVTFLTVYSMYILAQAAEKTGCRLCSFDSLAQGLLGRGWDYLASFVMSMFCFGSCVSYVISTGDIIESITGSFGTDSFAGTPWGNRLLLTGVWGFLMLPLAIMKEINSLRYVSVISVLSMVFFILVIVIHASTHGFEDGRPKQKLSLFKSGNDSVTVIGVIIFAYVCQTNAFEVYTEMRKPSPARLTRDSACSMSVCCLLYVVAGLFGYLEFGEKVTGSILLHYDARREPLVAVAYFGIALKMCVSFAICILPTRDSLYYCLAKRFPTFKNISTVPFWLNAVMCGVLSVLALLLGLLNLRVNVIFNLVGGFCGGFIGFIFPALFIMYSGGWYLSKVGWFHYINTYFLLIMGVVAVVLGTASSIYDLIG